MLPRRRPSSTPSRSPSGDLSHVGSASAPEKVRICRFTKLLPRIARLPLLKIQTPRTPRTSRRQELYHNGREQKGGAAVVPPWGCSIRRPPKVCEACEITSPIAFRYARPITARESERPNSLWRPRFLIPSLCLSPGGGGPPESVTKFASSASCWASWVDFLPFPSVLQK